MDFLIKCVNILSAIRLSILHIYRENIQVQTMNISLPRTAALILMSWGFLLWIIHDISWWVMKSRLKEDEAVESRPMRRLHLSSGPIGRPGFDEDGEMLRDTTDRR